jgi:predicted nucleotidyltransferase
LPVAALAAELQALPGAVAVVLGGSRADGTHRPDSDWDLGLYYRGSARPLDPDDVRALGHPGYVSALGEWGPIVHGGAWLPVAGTAVDVLFRDLDVVEGWMADAEEGRFAVLAQNGHLVGAPTYLPTGELATCVPVAGEVLPRPAFPPPLAALAPPRWEGRAAVALLFASAHARNGDAVACAGMLAAAALNAAHGRLCARAEWARNEKRIVERAGLGAVQPLLARPGAGRDELERTVAGVVAALGIEPLGVR